MKLEHAQKIAESLIADLKPFCHRIEIGGSIRRKKPEVKDIELVVIPKFGEIGTGQISLGGEESTISVNMLFNELHQRFNIHKGGDKYIQFGIIDGGFHDRKYIDVDVFTATFRTWGYIFMIRTGPAEFSKWVVTKLKREGCEAKGGEVFHHGTPCTVPSEEDLFFLLGIDCIEPEYRFKDVMWK